MTIAEQYIANAQDGRDPDTPIIRVESGSEPKMFTCNFHGWAAKKTGFVVRSEFRTQALCATRAEWRERECRVVLAHSSPYAFGGMRGVV